MKAQAHGHPVHPRFMVFGPISSVYDYLTFGCLSFFHATGSLFQTAWFIESITTQTLIIFAIRTRKARSKTDRPS